MISGPLHQVQQILVGEKLEGRLPSQMHDVEAGIDLRTLSGYQRQALVEGRLLVKLGDLPRGQQLPRLPVDVGLVLLDHRLQVAVFQGALGDEIAFLLKLLYLFDF